MEKNLEENDILDETEEFELLILSKYLSYLFLF